MTALAKIKGAGFSLSLTDAGNLKIAPFSKLTYTRRNYLKANKPEIIAELKAEAANDNAKHDIEPWQTDAITRWFAHINETDPSLIADFWDQVEGDP